MSLARALRVTASSAVVALVVGTVTISAAEAAPPRVGSVTGLATDVSTGSGSYQLAVHWNATSGATSYRVSVVKGGLTLASSNKVTGTTWSPTVTSSPGSATISVAAVAGHKKGKASTQVVDLPDVTGPTGTYTSSWVDATMTATITQMALDDDSGAAGVTRTVDWGDGSPMQPWATGPTITHTYTDYERHVPWVTLVDAAHNQTVLEVPAVIIGDTVAPSGAFAVARTTAWANLTKVTLNQTALADNKSPRASIARTIDWGDGTSTDWTTGTSTTHVYAKAGTFTPKVTMTDEAHCTADATTDAVTVKLDSTNPVVSFVLPKSRHSVRAFSTLKGKATDTGGTGVATVNVKAVEKRGTTWFAYNAVTQKWVKAATKTRAFSRAKAAVVTTGSRHLWAVKLSGLHRGTLSYRAFAKDRVGHRSAAISHQATLTRA